MKRAKFLLGMLVFSLTEQQLLPRQKKVPFVTQGTIVGITVKDGEYIYLVKDSTDERVSVKEEHLFGTPEARKAMDAFENGCQAHIKAYHEEQAEKAAKAQAKADEEQAKIAQAIEQAKQEQA